jgi:polysaccharide export outer membrane protein
VGEVAAAGLSTPQLEERLKEAYGGNYLKHPQLTVNVAEYHSVPVVVTGAVEKPGLYCLTSNRSTVLECLALAGGLKSTAADELLIIRGGESPSPAVSPGGSSLTQAAGKAGQPSAGQAQDTVPVDLKQLVEQGNMLMNLPVKAGDVLIVPSRARRYIYVLGYVNRPGAYELDEGSQMDALRAVAMGGGLAGIARPSNSFLIRETPPRGQTAIPVDLEEVARGVLPPLRLQPGDTLVVGTTAFGRMSQFIAPSMGATFSASASVAK